MKLSLKVFLISFLVSIAGFGLVQAGASDLFSGYAWSENIGWISFNCTDNNSCASFDYAVTFSEATGVFSGYAWSENIGWISFGASDLVGCPSGVCQAHIATSTNEISGWGKALAHGDGWEGWISLRGVSPDYGVDRNTSTQELEGYAWGGDVVGWLSFNCSDDSSCGTIDYAVDIYGGDTDEPYSWISSPSSNSWFLDDFTIYTNDEDYGSGLDEDKCEYKIINYNAAGQEQSSSGYLSRTCNSTVGITVEAGSAPTGCAYEGEDTCVIYVRSTDNAGNVYSPSVGENSIKSYHVDWTAPAPGKLYVTAPGEPEPINVTEGEISALTAITTDNLKVASCALFINGNYQSDTVTLGSGTTNRTASVDHQFVLSPGTYHNNYIKCRDAAGNISTSEPTTAFNILGGTGPIITDLTAFSSHCDTPSTECTSQYSCCMDYTTQSNCCVKFNLSAYEPDGLPLDYSWTFGDSGTSTDEDPSHHYSGADTFTATVTVSNGAENSQKSIEIVATNPTLSVDLSAIPSFGSSPLNNVDLRDIVTGTMFGTVDYKFDCVEGSGWDLEVSGQSSVDYIAVDVCSYAEGSYTAKTTVYRGTGSISDTIGITAAGSCVYNSDPELNESTTCNSDQGCSHTIDCQSDSTWPVCPTDTCTVGNTQSCGTGGEQTCSDTCAWGNCIGTGDCTSDFDCYCPLDSCSSGDYYNYPIYGSCENYFCNIETTATTSPCYPEVSIDDPSCNTPPICNSLESEPSSGVGPLTVTLTAEGIDDDGAITHYEFNFGDGTYTIVTVDGEHNTITSKSVNHEYAEPETASTTYTAEVKARDEDYDWSTVNAQTDIVVTKNIPPVASLGCDASSCGTGSVCNVSGTSIVYNQNCQFIFTNESTDDDSSNPANNDHIEQSVWSIFYDGGAAWYDPYDTYTGASTMNSLTLPTGMPQSQAYYVYLEVEDVKGASSTTSLDFYMRREIVSSFQCSLDPGEEKVWKSCNNLSVSEDETVYLKDLSVASEIAGGETATISTWAWTFTGGTPVSSSLQEPTVSFVQGVANTGRIALVVTDDAGRTDTTAYDLIITIPLPEWQEIAPI